MAEPPRDEHQPHEDDVCSGPMPKFLHDPEDVQHILQKGILFQDLLGNTQ